ncbi:MAG: IS200/IS605 family transposase [Ignavibacteriales bacterium]|nr:IS200/IS605 family transposase [Ignavibacteriales bacterium]
MANTYSQVYLHFVFAVKNRDSLIRDSWRRDLYKYISGIVKNKGHKQLALNGTSNHLHLFVGFKISQAIPDFMKDVKTASSIWINQQNFHSGKFMWQEGYGVFSYAQSQIDSVVKYINNQEEHHRVKTFTEEYTLMLEKFKISYSEKYILQDII